MLHHYRSNNLVLVSSPDIQHLEDADLTDVFTALVKQGFLPMNIALRPQLERNDEYFEALGKALDTAWCFLVIIGEKGNNLEEPAWAYWKREVSMAQEKGVRVVVLVHKLSEAKQDRDCPVGDWVDRIVWNERRDLISKTISALAKLKANDDLKDDRYYADAINLQGFYYSAISLTVRDDYWLQIGTKPLRTINGVREYPAREWGFHDEHSYGKGKNYYAGVAHAHGDFLHVHLERNGDELNFKLYLGSHDVIGGLQSKDIFFGAMHGLSLKSGRKSHFSYKTILAKTESAEQKIDVAHQTQIQRHLYLSRKSFYTKSEVRTYNNIEDLEIVHGERVNKARHLTGIYKVWTEGLRDSGAGVIQSMMKIDASLRTTIFNPIFKNEELFCEVSFIRPNKIMFVMRQKHTDRGVENILSVAVMEMPHDREQLSRPMVGSFCSIGMSSKKKRKTEKTPPPRLEDDVEVRGGYFVAILEDIKTPEGVQWSDEAYTDLVEKYDVKLLKDNSKPISKAEIDKSDEEMYQFLRRANGREGRKGKKG
jgi:hypothetical protein